MKPTYKEAFDVCVQYYVDRGYTVDHATAYVTTVGKKDIFRIYGIIQEEMKKPVSDTMVDLLQKR